MQTSFVIDQAATFGGKAKFTKISIEPKLKFGTETGEQATTKAGVPQYTVQVLMQYVNQFDNQVAEVLKLTVASESDPGAKIPDMAAVEFEDLTVGVMEKENGGFTMFFRAEAIRAAGSGSQAAQAGQAGAVEQKSSKAA